MHSEQRSKRVADLLKKRSDHDKIKLVTGGGYALKAYNNVMGAAGRTCTTLLKKGVPNIVLSDGPAGLNVNQSVISAASNGHWHAGGICAHTWTGSRRRTIGKTKNKTCPCLAEQGRGTLNNLGFFASYMLIIMLLFLSEIV